MLSISNIIAGVAGQTPKGPAYYSYSCQPGMKKSQYPAAQGAVGQSVGGLLCNSDGYLELARPSIKQLCIPGEGGVYIQNDLSQGVATCGTCYPGDESMTDATWAAPGAKVPVWNPNQSSYFKWKDMKTSAQYYINPAGVPVEKACIWGSAASTPNTGNWAAVNLGVGMDDNGITYISLFLNKPTSNAQPDFNMEVLGGNSPCGFKDGAWIGGSDGCTTGLAKGQTATVRFY
ncbi:hypothetical protein NQ176_g8097 [Zarea fungicola]|uniref:Uncharacterized protein n=1 Tax=Zarea fungicola TaxID=93591 RepID=A0ACC1MUD0_9HYPO|nr:hypothetical protein NQ176_g8097 [Lecanicillium fungicola]